MYPDNQLFPNKQMQQLSETIGEPVDILNHIDNIVDADQALSSPPDETNPMVNMPLPIPIDPSGMQ